MRTEDLVLVLWIIFTALTLRWHTRRMTTTATVTERRSIA
jgi:hypothetical protein